VLGGRALIWTLDGAAAAAAAAERERLLVMPITPASLAGD